MIKKNMHYLDIYTSTPILFIRDVTLEKIHPFFCNFRITLPVSIRLPIFPSCLLVPFSYFRQQCLPRFYISFRPTNSSKIRDRACIYYPNHMMTVNVRKLRLYIYITIPRMTNPGKLCPMFHYRRNTETRVVGLWHWVHDSLPIWWLASQHNQTSGPN